MESYAIDKQIQTAFRAAESSINSGDLSAKPALMLCRDLGLAIALLEARVEQVVEGIDSSSVQSQAEFGAEVENAFRKIRGSGLLEG